MHDHDPQPWQCDECGHVNSPDSPVCLCYFWDEEVLREVDNWTERHRTPHDYCTVCDQWLWTFEEASTGVHDTCRQEPAPDLSQWLTVPIQEGAE